MEYTTLSFKTLRTLYDLHVRMALECPEELTECDHAERHELSMELDRRNSLGDSQ